MAVTKAQQKAVGKYESENYDKVLLRLPKGKRDEIKAYAQEQSMSLNAYIISLIEKDREEKPCVKETPISSTSAHQSY